MSDKNRILKMIGVAMVMFGSGSFVHSKKETDQEKLDREFKDFAKFNDYELDYIRSLPKLERKKAVEFLNQKRIEEWNEKQTKEIS